MESLSGQKVVITGITGGIAYATAQRLLDLDADLIVSARTQDKLDTALSNLKGDIKGHTMDLSDASSIESFFAKTGPFDHLVTPAASSTLSPIKELDLAAARELLETKQWGQMLCVHHALEHLSKTGSITLFSGTVSQKPMMGASLFASVGAATEAAARIWGLELAPIRVNTIVPGVVETPVWQNLVGDEAQATLQTIGESLPVGHIGKADDIAKAVAFLIDNSFISGHDLVLDGGHRLI